MNIGQPFALRGGISVAVSALAFGALLAAPATSHAIPFLDQNQGPGGNTVVVDSSKYATDGGHGNFRWRYSASKKNVCGIYPVGRGYVVRCAAKNKSAADADEKSDEQSGETSTSKSKYDGIQLGGTGVKRVKLDDDQKGFKAKRLMPNHTIDVVGITCTAYKRATLTCQTSRGSFKIVGGVVQR
ncbi:MAG: hypothetical protein QM728_02690 [Gordonia sp. (in: high G+C Gram-positive bacteria)]|uniref:hypothetical protein n=1 Tax=Gordonia sp. (in: high G+C Gram-positive bacteria) TaxID=84139 RepID=UPI0039E275ED